MVVQEWNASSASCNGRTNGNAVRSESVIERVVSISEVVAVLRDLSCALLPKSDTAVP